MLSIITCSKDKCLPDEFVTNITNTVGVEFELVHINNSTDAYSIFSAYNLGIEKSRFPYLCFVHVDVKFHTDNWGVKLINHLKYPEAGLIGIAGGNLITRIPASWSALPEKSVHIIQSDKSGRKSEKIHIPADFSGTKRPAILLDGVFLGIKKELAIKCRFDEAIKGFHGYDFDISLQSIQAGYRNYVVYDISLEHFSKGNRDRVYYENQMLVYKKWQKSLPIAGNQPVGDIENRLLIKLIQSLGRTGFSYREILKEIGYFSKLISAKSITPLRILIRVFLLRLVERPRYLFR